MNLNIFKKIFLSKEYFRRKNKTSIIIWIVLRVLVVLCMALQFLHGDLNNALLCLISLILLCIPIFIQNKFEIELPSTFEICIYLFIFSAEILGEINNFYTIIPYWDMILHTINGFLATAVGFSLFELLDKNSKNIKLSPLFLCVVAFCFSMTIGVIWEFGEYGADKILKKDTQKDEIVSQIVSVNFDETNTQTPITISDIKRTVIYGENDTVLAVVDDGYLDVGINDTMEDLLVNLIGAIIFCIFAYCQMQSGKKNKKTIKFIEQFVPKRKKDKEVDIKL